jgi:predicted nuclease with TOPRIM domain
MMREPSLALALTTLRPGASCIIRDGVIEWLDQTQTQPTEEEIQAEIKRLQEEYERTEYQRKRLSEYPSIGDQLDALFHAGLFPSEMAQQIQAVKVKYPKPN